MVSAIDITKPIYGTPTTQSVRDNFHIARDEITNLQDLSTRFVNRSGDTMTGRLVLSGPPVNQNDATTLNWVLQQMHSSVNTLIFIGDYDGVNDIILTSGQPQFIVGQPLPPASPTTSQFYFVVKSSQAPGIGNQPPEGVTQGTFLISNGVGWINFAMTAAEVIAQTVPVSPAITNVPGTNVYDALAGIGQNFLLKSGGTLTGDLVLNRVPVLPLGAATKGYVDGLISGLTFPAEAPMDGFGYVRLSGAWSHTPIFNRVRIDTDIWGHLTLNSTTASNTANQITGMKDNLPSWTIQIGPEFELYRYDNAGTIYDGVPVLAISRANGAMVLRHNLQFDLLVAGQASIFGRGPNNPTDPNNDTFNIYARMGVANCSVIALRGPTFPGDPNGIDLVAGTQVFQFNSNGVLYTPASIVLPIDTGLFLGSSSIAKYGPNLFFNLNADWRMYADESTGWWFWQGYPNFDNKMYLTDTGSLWLKGELNVNATGIRYGLVGAVNTYAFGWNGNVNCYVDGAYQGDLAFINWVNAYFKPIGAYTPNQTVDINTGPNFANVMLGGGFLCRWQLQLLFRPQSKRWLLVDC